MRLNYCILAFLISVGLFNCAAPSSKTSTKATKEYILPQSSLQEAKGTLSFLDVYERTMFLQIDSSEMEFKISKTAQILMDNQPITLDKLNRSFPLTVGYMVEDKKNMAYKVLQVSPDTTKE